jgi:molybdopterin-biosynthesis enzyme MoeA-like protein
MIPGMPLELAAMVNTTMSEAMKHVTEAQNKVQQQQIIWDCQEVDNPKDLPTFLARQGKVISPQVFFCGGKLFILFGRT